MSRARPNKTFSDAFLIATRHEATKFEMVKNLQVAKQVG
jgi:hypothetical protein